MTTITFTAEYLENAITRELALLSRCEDLFGIPARPVVTQLANFLMRPLPDVLPKPPQWTAFDWPKSGEIDLRGYWREFDRGRPYFGSFGA